MKFKVGDRVKIIKSELGGIPHSGTQEYIGTETRIKSVGGGTPFHPYKVQNNTAVWSDNELELISSQEERKFKVGDRVKVVKRFEENISGGDRTIGIIGVIQKNVTAGTFSPKEYEGQACYIVHEKERGEGRYYGYFIAQELELVNNLTPFGEPEFKIPAFEGTKDGFQDKPKGKIMSVIKNIFKSKEQKALSRFNITNGDGGLTEKGKEEFVDYLYETLKTERTAFIKEIVKEYDRERKENK